MTKMKFDSTVGIGYPKVLFARDRFLTDEDMDILVPVLQSQKVKQLISTSWTPNGVDGVKQGAISGPADDEAAGAAKDVTPKIDAEKVAAEVKAQLEASEKAAKKAVKLAAAQAAADAAKAAAEAAVKAAEDDDDDAPVVTKARAAVDADDDEPVAVKATAKADKPKADAKKVDKPAAAVPAGVPAGMAELLGKWGD